MEYENKQTPQTLEQELDQLEERLLESELGDEESYGLDQSFESALIDREEVSSEKESFLVRTKLGRLALKVVSDPIFSLGVTGAALNNFANTYGDPSLLRTGLAVASTGVATWRALDISNKHFDELSAAEQAADQAIQER